MQKITVVSLESVDNAAIALARKIRQSQAYKEVKYKYVAPILRGGSSPAAMLSYYLNIPLTQGIKIQTCDRSTPFIANIAQENRFKLSETLFVDDLIDSGKTYDIAQNILGITHITALFHKGKCDLNMSEHLKPTKEYAPDEWLDFPWERGLAKLSA